MSSAHLHGLSQSENQELWVIPVSRSRSGYGRPANAWTCPTAPQRSSYILLLVCEIQWSNPQLICYLAAGPPELAPLLWGNRLIKYLLEFITKCLKQWAAQVFLLPKRSAPERSPTRQQSNNKGHSGFFHGKRWWLKGDVQGTLG